MWEGAYIHCPIHCPIHRHLVPYRQLNQIQASATDQKLGLYGPRSRASCRKAGRGLEPRSVRRPRHRPRIASVAMLALSLGSRVCESQPARRARAGRVVGARARQQTPLSLTGMALTCGSGGRTARGSGGSQ